MELLLQVLFHLLLHLDLLQVPLLVTPMELLLQVPFHLLNQVDLQ